MKRIIKMLLALSLVSMMSFNVLYAENIDDSGAFMNISEITEVIKDFLPEYESNILQIGSYYLGEAIPIYDMDSVSGELQLRTSIKYYPIFKNNEVIFTIIDMGGGNLKISDEGVTGLNDSFQEADSFMLISNGQTCISITEENQSFVVEGENNPGIVKELLLSDDYLSLEFNNMDKAAIPYVPDYAEIMTRELNLPFKHQHSDTACWAACIASFVQHYTGTSKTSSGVVSDLGTDDGTKTMSQIKTYLSDEYGIGTTHSSSSVSSSASSLRSYIDSSKASILGWARTGTNVGHVTVLSGYTTVGTSYRYTIMDPLKYATYTLQSSSSTDFPSNTKITENVTYTLVERLTYSGLTQ